MTRQTKVMIIGAIAFWAYVALWLYVLYPAMDKMLVIQ
jgi:hypothetical protein